jgi:hypothetical protein
MGKNILAEWEKLRNFATDFNGEITKRYARSADRNSATAINKRGLQQYCAQASFRSPMFVTLRFPSA